jgi:hypothetical protein
MPRTTNGIASKNEPNGSLRNDDFVALEGFGQVSDMYILYNIL